MDEPRLFPGLQAFWFEDTDNPDLKLMCLKAGDTEHAILVNAIAVSDVAIRCLALASGWPEAAADPQLAASGAALVAQKCESSIDPTTQRPLLIFHVGALRLRIVADPPPKH